MAKYEWSEVFMSIEGEARYSGHPTVYIRFARCNFQCRGFNNPEYLDTTDTKILGFDPKHYKNIHTIPLITRGCDSIYSWDEKFSHMWKVGNENELGEELLKVLPHNSFVNPLTGRRVILSLTGGEPTLRLKFLPALLKAEAFQECKHIILETNASVPMKTDHLKTLADVCVKNNIWITWSNSPKLSTSGESWKDAIRPDVVVQQSLFMEAVDFYSDRYFKFVCGPNEKDFAEVEKAMHEYYQRGCVHKDTTDVYIMPVACTEEQQHEISAQVARMCIDRGYIYCHRIQNSVFGNGVGT